MTLPDLPRGVISPGFDGPLDLRVWVPGEWVVLGDVNYTALDGSRFTIPRTFITDLASIPRPAQAIFAIDDATRMPAVLHDWLYCSRLVERDRADDLLREALARAGVNWVKRQTIWSAVRAGGWVYFNRRDGIAGEDFAILA